MVHYRVSTVQYNFRIQDLVSVLKLHVALMCLNRTVLCVYSFIHSFIHSFIFAISK